MKRPTKGPLLFAALTGAALLFGGGLCFLLYNNYSSASDKAMKLKKEVSDEAALMAELEASRAKLGEGSEQLQHLELGVSTAEFIPTLLKNLEDTGKDCSLHIIGVKPVDPNSSKSKKAPTNDGTQSEQKISKKPYVELEVEVKAAGMFNQLMEFLKRLENFPKIVAVRSVSIQPRIQPDGMTIDRLEATINLRMFVFPAVVSASNGDGSKAGGA